MNTDLFIAPSFHYYYMGSSSSQELADSDMYTHPSWFDYHLDKEVTVYVFSYRIIQALGFGVHHCIGCDGVGDGKWRVCEWGPRGLQTYACVWIKGHKHRMIGKYKLGDVMRAVHQASDYRSYSSSYNCNIWTENVAWKLGWDINCAWNCRCVINSPTVTWYAD